jgi:hypothetical protein
MCGIMGIIAGRHSRFDPRALRPLLDRLMCLSESRGKEASGVVLAAGPRIEVLKRPVRAASLTRSKDYRCLIRRVETGGSDGGSDPLVAMGHTRMVTHGSAANHENNQPVVRRGMLCLHNGIVVNDRALWRSLFGTEQGFELDTEIIVRLVAHFREHGRSLAEAVRSAFELLKGANSIALMAEDTDAVILASTNGSLYAAAGISGAEFVYASEKHFLKKALQHPALASLFAGAPLFRIGPRAGAAIRLDPVQVFRFDLGGHRPLPELPRRKSPRLMVDLKPNPEGPPRPKHHPAASAPGTDRLVAVDEHAIASLRRCSRCLLPETFPLIEFDRSGTCNYCRNYKRIVHRGEADLIRFVSSRRKPGGGPDCLVPLSGGRDSSYALHYVTKVLGMKPVAYTYDWGMVTDLARRNISRMCGELGIEHILISADIRRKRRHIRKNVSAWLRKPDLGTVPLFMAGDKPFFYYANLLGRQMGIGTTLFSMNPLERTDFKSAFCGVSATHAKKMFWDLSAFSKLRLLLYYGRVLLQNPAYVNSSMTDTLWAYVSYYFLPKAFSLLYDYVVWDEAVINATLASEYDWETATDSNSTWRIGDGTAAFYNYIYYRLAGFTENDTFRSNQIREGQLTREDALARVNADNRPRPESIRWYCDTVDIDYRDVLRRINAIRPLYDDRARPRRFPGSRPGDPTHRFHEERPWMNAS